MSHDDRAADVLAEALRVAADEWQPNDGEWEQFAAEHVLAAYDALGLAVVRMEQPHDRCDCEGSMYGPCVHEGNDR